jgi:hypothetical protein
MKETMHNELQESITWQKDLWLCLQAHQVNLIGRTNEILYNSSIENNRSSGSLFYILEARIKEEFKP